MGGLQNFGREGCVVYLPAGRYRITQTLEILQSNVVMRGDGVREGTGALRAPRGRAWPAAVDAARSCSCTPLPLPSSPPPLNGSQAGKTALFFPKGLQGVYGNKVKWAVSGGFIV